MRWFAAVFACLLPFGFSLRELGSVLFLFGPSL